MKEFADRVLKDQVGGLDEGTARLALLLAVTARNEAIGVPDVRKNERSAWEVVAAEHPACRNALRSRDADELIDELGEYKLRNYRSDRRRIASCGLRNGNIRIEWLPSVDD